MDMKKITALLLLCLLLCATCSVALAATITYYDEDYGEEKTIEVSGTVYTLPTYEEIGFTPSASKTFYGWKVITKEAYYKPGSKVNIRDEQEIIAHYVNTNEQIFEVQIVSREYNDNHVAGYYPCTYGELLWLPYPYQYGFGSDAENLEYFEYWKVEGEFELFDPSSNPGGSEWGWIPFAVALAEEQEARMNPGDYFYVHGPVTATAIWKNSGNEGGNQGGNEGGNQGGNEGGNQGGNNNAANNMPQTGDNSLPMVFLLAALMTSICGICLLAKKRTN